MIKPTDSGTSVGGALPKDPEAPQSFDQKDVEAFEQALEQPRNDEPPAKTERDLSIYRMAGWTGIDAGGNSTKPNLDNFEPEKPDLPKPEEPKSGFLSDLQNNVKKGLDSVKEFLAKPELAKYVRAANIVFAGAMVVTAGVLFATGVGAPAGIAALALAGSAGLAMQLPQVHDKIQAGVVAMMAPILGQDTAEKLGPLVTQGMIAGIMIAIVATGGQAGSAQGALNAAVDVFKNLNNVFNGMSEVYQSASPFLGFLGVEVDSAAIKQMAGVFGTMATILPDLSSFAGGMGQSLTEFLKKPDMDKFGQFLKGLPDIPDSIIQLLDAPFLKNLGSMLDALGEFAQDATLTNLVEFLKNAQGMLPQKA